MIDISIEEAIRCLHFYQEFLPEKGYVSCCFDMAISALKTIKDMQLNDNYIPALQHTTFEIIKKLSEYKCSGINCNECVCTYKNVFSDYNCVSAAAGIVLSDYSSFKHVYEWLQSHPDIVAQWKEEIERSENNE